jgi:hypothetical protein
LRIPVTKFRGDIHLSALEKSWMSQVEEDPIHWRQDFWIVVAGGKYDFTAKWWDPSRYQRVVDHFAESIQFVQCGESHHYHPRLRGVIDLVGKTDVRQFVRLMYHASGVVCPVTFAMHLAAAVEVKPGRPKNRRSGRSTRTTASWRPTAPCGVATTGDAGNRGANPPATATRRTGRRTCVSNPLLFRKEW